LNWVRRNLHKFLWAPNVAKVKKVLVATIACYTLSPTTANLFNQKGENQRSSFRGCLAEDELGLEKATLDPSLDTDLPNETRLLADRSRAGSYLEIGLTSDRADSWSHLGVSADLKSFVKRKLCNDTVGPILKIGETQGHKSLSK